MPKIVLINPRDPRAPRIGRIPAPGSIGGGLQDLGAGIGEIGKEVQRIQEESKQQEDNIVAAELLGEMDLKIAGIESQEAKIPTEDRAKFRSDAFSKLRKDILGRAGKQSKFTSAVVQTRIPSREAQFFAGGFRRDTAIGLNERRARLDDVLSISIKKLINSSDLSLAENIGEHNAVIEQARRLGIISDTEAGDFRRRDENLVMIGRLEAGILADPFNVEPKITESGLDGRDITKLLIRMRSEQRLVTTERRQRDTDEEKALTKESRDLENDILSSIDENPAGAEKILTDNKSRRLLGFTRVNRLESMLRAIEKRGTRPATSVEDAVLEFGLSIDDAKTEDAVDAIIPELLASTEVNRPDAAQLFNELRGKRKALRTKAVTADKVALTRAEDFLKDLLGTKGLFAKFDSDRATIRISIVRLRDRVKENPNEDPMFFARQILIEAAGTLSNAKGGIQQALDSLPYQNEDAVDRAWAHDQISTQERLNSLNLMRIGRTLGISKGTKAPAPKASGRARGGSSRF